ncbi:S-locus glycoprotein [Corchorus capsularis]|uniref:S-locus glycoprotein n=1 Tax=Corchorus capsularis TaxID=210143 RepID=A0A1R3I9D7_COCAP|nr:S-locus glycoprotein [Corchorus capsularis]
MESENDPSPGSFVLGLDPHQSPPQAYTWINGSLPFWRSGPWDKTTFIGIHGMESSYSSVYALDVDDELGTVYFYAKPYNQSFYRNIFLPSDGYLRIVGKDLDVPWEVIANPCDMYGTCGPFGVCKPFESPICTCLEGFVPKSNNEWSKGKENSISKGMPNESNVSSEILPSYTSSRLLKFEDQSELPMFDLNSILVATDNFSIQNKLGQGGFGPVYKGKLSDKKLVAVKRLSSSSGQGLEEFKNEVMLISKLQHRNLVRLYGYCNEKEERILIYEFMANKSLDTFLFDPRKKAQLNWARRFSIIQGVARGLLYLHRDSCLRVIHRDLKVGNILLDDKMNPKISDFGLARIFQGTQDLANTHKVVGTLGYMSPEYALGGIFSEKTDVFSFGVLVLEIVNGKKVTTSYCVDQDQYISLLNYAWQMWHESKEIELMDEALATDSFSSSQVKRCIHVGLLCVQDHAENRPTMPQVVFMLSSETELPKPKQPTFTFHKALNSDGSNSKSDRIWSVNEEGLRAELAWAVMRFDSDQSRQTFSKNQEEGKLTGINERLSGQRERDEERKQREMERVFIERGNEGFGSGI